MLIKLLKKEQFKNAEATRDLSGNKIANKITSIGKPKEKEKTKQLEKIYISQEEKVVDDLKLF